MNKLTLDKELVRSYDYSDYNEDRIHATDERIDGRVYVKFGRHTSTAFVGEVFDIHAPSDEPLKYVLLIGMSRQHPDEHTGTKEIGVELAAQNALINPIARIDLPDVPSYEMFKTLCENYMKLMPKQFIRTKEERELAELRRDLRINYNKMNKLNPKEIYPCEED